jgi:hypothetical protein
MEIRSPNPAGLRPGRSLERSPLLWTRSNDPITETLFFRGVHAHDVKKTLGNNLELNVIDFNESSEYSKGADLKVPSPKATLLENKQNTNVTQNIILDVAFVLTLKVSGERETRSLNDRSRKM